MPPDCADQLPAAAKDGLHYWVRVTVWKLKIADPLGEAIQVGQRCGGAVGLTAVTIALVVIDVVSALGLLFLVLLHSGRGGGLSDMFGGGFGTQAAGSTVIEKNLDRLTIVAALIFAFSTLALALLLDSS